jgi:exopolysaccharide biosynthesis polyprenyl glycosylphosphotransferase
MVKPAEDSDLTTTLQAENTAAPLRFPLGPPERRLILLLGDVLVLLSVGVAALAAWAVLGPGLTISRAFIMQQWPWLAGLGATWLILCAVNDGYDLRVAADSHLVSRQLFFTAMSFLILYLSAFFVLSVPSALFAFPFADPGRVMLLRLMPMLFIVSALLAELAWRNCYLTVLRREPFQRRAIVVGAGRAGQTIAQIVREYAAGAYQIVGFVDDDPAKLGKEVWKLGNWKAGEQSPLHPSISASLLVLGDRHALHDLITRHRVSTLILAITHQFDGQLLPALLDCLELGVEIVPMPVLYEQLTGRVPVEHVGDNWYVAMPIQPPITGSLQSLLKRLMDVILAGLGLICLGLALPFIAAAIYLDSPGPIFYTQERVGKGGRLFRTYKFRSMVTDAEQGQAIWAQRDDPRVTCVGRLLRKAHVDEFPQFVNILRGEMSAVGPRPERPEFVEELAKEIPFYRVRHAVKPGMAGWGLVRQGYGSSAEDAMLKLEYDLYYIKHQSLWLDMVILLKTIVHTITFRGR